MKKHGTSRIHGKMRIFFRKKPDIKMSSLPLLEANEGGRQSGRIADYNSTSIDPIGFTHLSSSVDGSIQDPVPQSSLDPQHVGTTYSSTLSPRFMDGSNQESAYSSSGYTSIGMPSRSYMGGFSTSISDIFLSQNDRTVDICSLFCCGVLQFEYNRYFLTGGRFKPKNFSQRFFWYIFIPVFAFSLAGYFSVHVNNNYFGEMTSSLLVLFSFSWIVYLSFRSSMRRGQVRLAMFRWLKLHGNSQATVDIDITTVNGSGIDDDDRPRCTTCVHRSCAFYPVDYDDELDQDVDKDNDLDFCSLLSICFSKACCGFLCGCWLQCCGVCALAQEARQINRLISPEKRLVDYVTFERYCEYFEHIKKIRTKQDSAILNHFKAVSKLSRMLLKTLGLTT
jgi:hypothetical protein